MIETDAAPEESLYKRLVDNLPDLVFVIDSQGHFLSAYGDTSSILGYSREELCRMNLLEVTHYGGGDPPPSPADHPLLKLFSDPACGSKTISEFQMTAKSASGEVRFLEVNGTGVFDPVGKLASLYIVARDITFRKRLQARVEYLRQLNEQIIGSMQEGMLVLEVPDLRVLSANRRFLSAVGLHEGQVIGLTCGEIYSRNRRPEFLAEMPHLLQRTLTTGKVSFRELQASDLMPSPMTLELTLQPLAHEGKAIRQVLVLLRDITRRKRLETDMRRRLQKLSSLNEVSEALQGAIHQLEDVLQVVLVGVTAGEGLGFNRAFVLLVDEAAGLLQTRLSIGPSDPSEAQEIWSRINHQRISFASLLRTPRPPVRDLKSRLEVISNRLSVPLLRKEHILVRSLEDNQPFMLVHGRVPGQDDLVVDPELLALLDVDSFVVVPLRTTQKAIGVLLADNFITRRQILFEDLEFLKILTHQASYAIENARLYRELAQKVQDLGDANRILQEQQQALIEAERLSTIGKMAATVAHEIRNPLVTIGGYARSLLRDIPPENPQWEDLDIITREVVRMEYIVNEVLGYARYAQPQPVLGDLNQLVSDTVRTFRANWTLEKVQIDVELDPGLPPVSMDAQQIRQVLINMLLNAVQAMPNGGRMMVDTRAGGKGVMLTVSDTGLGIPESLKEHVFKPFFTTKSSGTGLGLNIASEIIAAHGGDIQFESAPNKGTTFRITLPRAKKGVS